MSFIDPKERLAKGEQDKLRSKEYARQGSELRKKIRASRKEFSSLEIPKYIEKVICKKFGCSSNLSLPERLAGDYCINHQSPTQRTADASWYGSY